MKSCNRQQALSSTQENSTAAHGTLVSKGFESITFGKTLQRMGETQINTENSPNR